MRFHEAQTAMLDDSCLCVESSSSSTVVAVNVTKKLVTQISNSKEHGNN